MSEAVMINLWLEASPCCEKQEKSHSDVTIGIPGLSSSKSQPSPEQWGQVSQSVLSLCNLRWSNLDRFVCVPYNSVYGWHRHLYLQIGHYKWQIIKSEIDEYGHMVTKQ